MLPEQAPRNTSLARRGGAIAILAIVAYLLLKAVVGIVVWAAGAIVIVLAVIAVIWAIRQL